MTTHEIASTILAGDPDDEMVWVHCECGWRSANPVWHADGSVPAAFEEHLRTAGA
ncbi:hypothetical protein GCM10009623_08480 [Nocardioides aestuarii]|uniref:Uncharacterized protein n=1 Tax=Nocardioides aestuarii TaxID=252231 RepID=A0ABW4TFF2_9ACTN